MIELAVKFVTTSLANELFVAVKLVVLILELVIFVLIVFSGVNVVT